MIAMVSLWVASRCTGHPCISPQACGAGGGVRPKSGDHDGAAFASGGGYHPGKSHLSLPAAHAVGIKTAVTKPPAPAAHAVGIKTAATKPPAHAVPAETTAHVAVTKTAVIKHESHAVPAATTAPGAPAAPATPATPAAY